MRSWRKLAEWLMSWHDFDSENRKKLDAIERQHISDEARLKAVVEAFLLGGRSLPTLMEDADLCTTLGRGKPPG